MHLFEEMHPPLMSLPSRSESSLALSASLISQLALYNLGCAFASLSRATRKLFSSHLAMSWRLRAFLEFPGPPAIVPMQRLCKFHLRVTHYHQAYLTWFRYVLGLSQPLDASFRIGLSDLVSCRCRPWASVFPSKVSPHP